MIDNQLEISEEETEYEHIFKIVFLGDSGVGKTNILSVFNEGIFNVNIKSTIGVNFVLKTIKFNEEYIKL